MKTVCGWGDNTYGQVDPVNALTKIDSIVSGVFSGNVKKVACGENHTMVLTEEGNLYGWGDNQYAQVDPDQPHTKCTDTSIVIATEVSDVACGSNHTVIQRNAGTMSAWGRNNANQCNTSTADPYVIKSTSVPGVLKVDAGADFSCYLRTDLKIVKVGNIYQILDITSGVHMWPCEKGLFCKIGDVAEPSHESVDISGWIKGQGANEYREINPRTHKSIIDYTIGSVYRDTISIAHFGVAVDLKNENSLSSWGQHTVMVDSLNRIFAWGLNWCGESNPFDVPVVGGLDYGRYRDCDNPIPFPDGFNVKFVKCGYLVTYFISDSGELYGIGYNDDYRANPFGSAVTPFSSVATPIDINVLQVSTSKKTRTLLLSDGKEETPEHVHTMYVKE